MSKRDVHQQVNKLLEKRSVDWKKHALQRIFERNITRQEVFDALRNFEVVEEYPYDKPLPSWLVLGYVGEKPLHVVFALDDENDVLWIITVYVPSLEEWEDDLKTRRVQ